MNEYVILWEWLAFMVRWLHVITAMAWIGASFYFIALDLMLKPNARLPKGAHGEEWEVHGGGFYHTVKYLVAPEAMPEHLTWHKWQSYTTWLSGAALLMIIYWVGGEIFLLDPSKLPLALWQGIMISAASLALGWLVYDALCKSRLSENPTILMMILFAILMVMSWGYNQVFTGRAALLHLGAFTATIMTANVFFQIMPNQRIVVADLKAGRTPDAKYGKIAKVRSTHNNYLTLPVIFLMLSTHYPLAFGTEYAWLIAGLIFLTGVSIRHYFNTMHRTGEGPMWTWLVTIALIFTIAWLSSLGAKDATEDEALSSLPSQERRALASEHFEEAYYAVMGNCSMCHASAPSWDGIAHAPKDIILENERDVAKYAKMIYLQAGISHAMPPPNAIAMDEDMREAIRIWYEDVSG